MRGNYVTTQSWKHRGSKEDSPEKFHRPRPDLNLRASDPVASMITTGPLGSTNIYRISLDLIYISLTLNRFLWGWQPFIVGHRLGIHSWRCINRQRGRLQILFFYFIYFYFVLFIYFLPSGGVRSRSSTSVKTPLGVSGIKSEEVNGVSARFLLPVLIDQNFCGIGIEHRALQSPTRRTNVWKQDTVEEGRNTWCGITRCHI